MSVAERVAWAQQWVSDYTANPHPELGRDGVVCPYMVKALRQDCITLVDFDSSEGDAALAALAREMRGKMIKRAAELGADHVYLVNLIVPFGNSETELKAMVGRVHARLKEEFVSLGFMLGDFWPEHETAGLYSEDFRPFTSPLPILGMRHMVPADLVFFITPDLTPQQQLTYLGYYAKVFEGRLNRYWSGRLEQSEAAACAALVEVSGTTGPRAA
ncbi:DUF6875 domain-containing protein [Plantactinospora endophytica]|uniref:DUF6875 domain-containing protein n=1 Tax=Plantactinospora endophytica TaxID=673535 RepID=A0ABQ4ECA7_9ACTN|nr:hypothetical protein [Plantactinospora endophytica]GIG92285.1 hypothetical protein Pen02_72210 [Plantactinospora endophytica]